MKLSFTGEDTSRWVLGFTRATVLFLFFFVLAQPLSIAGAEIAFAVAGACWLVRVAILRRDTLQSSPLDVFILIFWVLCAISALLSPLPASSWEGMRKILLIFLVLLIAHNVPSPKRTRQFLAVIFLAGLISVGYSAWQYIGGAGARVVTCDPDGLVYQAGIRPGDVIVSAGDRHIRGPEGFLAVLKSTSPTNGLKLGVVQDAVSSELILDKDAAHIILPARPEALPSTLQTLGVTLAVARPPRARGFYSHFITYSDEMQMLLAITFGLWLSFRRRGQEHEEHQAQFPAFWFGVLAVIFGLTLGATLSRSAWLAGTFGLLVQLWFHVRRPAIRLLLPIVMIFALFGTNFAVQHWRGVSLFNVQDPSSQYRLLMWRDGLRLIRQHPWFGVGQNVVRDDWPVYNLDAFRLQGVRSHFHSTPMQFAVELGIPALIAWIAFMAAYWRLLARLVAQAREHPDPVLYGVSLGILGGTSGFLANSLVQYNFGDSVVVLLFWFLMGLALATRRHIAAR